MTNEISILHLSDLHIHGGADPVIHFMKLLPDCVEGVLKTSDRILILVSGDIAFSGASLEYRSALASFKGLQCELEMRLQKEIGWILVPGNHDGQFKNASKNRQFNIDGVIKEGEAAIDDSIVDACIAPQSAYFEFEKELVNSDSYQYKDPLLGIREINVGGKAISIWEFNASWMSRVPEVQGDLVFPISKYERHLRQSADFRFGVIHHPLNWYAQGTYHPFKQLITKNFCGLFSGHEHIRNGHIHKSLSDETQCMFLQAGALGPHDASETASFSILKFSVDSGDFELLGYTYSGDQDAFLKDESISHAAKFSLSTTREFEPTLDTHEALEELGAPFSHPTRDTLRLSDVYVEPVFSAFSISEEDAASITSAEVLEALLAEGKIIVRGDEHYGKTSFVNQLFYRVLNVKLVPVKMTARELSNGTEAKRERVIVDRISEHYGVGAIDSYKALPLSKKVILVDDLDKLGTNVEQYSRALDFIQKNFGKCLLTVGETFDVSLLGSSDVAERLGDFETYRMRGFSYSMRSDLIQRWYALDLSLDKVQLDLKTHDAQTRIDHAVAKALVPSTAFNTLMILQALEATQKSQVVDAGVAQHYDMLVRRRLADSGAVPKLFDGIYAYLSHLSWYLKRKNTTSLDAAELDVFNDYFRTTIHQVDTKSLVELLVKSRLLSSADSMFQFRHPSARYFFLAHYIAEYAEEDREARDFVLGACRRLYKKDNANLIVFLASKVASRWIVKEVAAVLSKLLVAISPFNVVSDSRVLNAWVNKTAKLAVDTTGDRDERKKRVREREEEAQSLEDQRSDKSEIDDVSQLDTFSQINLVFKTSEILGLILKSRFGSLEASLKKELIEELFNGPLRAISFFLEAVNDQPDALIEYLSKNWEDKLPRSTAEQRTKLAQKFVYFSLGAYAQALIQRQGEIAGSPDLNIYITNFLESVATEEGRQQRSVGSSLTYRLLAVASRLSYPADIPFGEIERLSRDLESNPFGFTILQGVVGNHLYMFEVSYSNRQRLATAVQLDLKTQVTNEMVAQDAKSVTGRRFNHRNPQSLLIRLAKSYLARNQDVMKRVGKKKPNE